MTFSLTERFWAARIVMVFITFICSLLGTICLTWMVRRHRDSARWCFTFAKFIGVLFSVYCFVDLCSFVLSIVSSRLLNAAIEKDYDNKGVVVAIILSHVEMAAAARFCDYLLIIFIFVSLITMGNGIIHSRTGSPGKNSKTIKRSADAISVLIGAICAAQWGLRIRVFLDLYLENYRVKHGSADMANLLNIARQLDFATLLIGLLCSLATMVRAVMIYLPTRADKQIYWPSHCLLFCSSLWLLRSLYDTVYQIRYVDLVDVSRSRGEEYYISVITAIVYIFPVLLILFAILGLGIRKSGGLWSTQQPWMLYDPDDSQDIPLEPQAPNLPPAYSPPLSSGFPPVHQQQTTQTWRGSPPTSTSPEIQPPGVRRRPLPPLSTTSGALPLPTQQAANGQPSEAVANTLGNPTSAPTNSQHTLSASSSSPGWSQRPFVIEDRGPALDSLPQSSPSHSQTMMRPLPTQPPATHEELRGFVPGASTVTAQVPSAVLIGESHASRPEKSPRQLPEQDTSQSSLTGHGTSPERYQQAPMDDGYNTGIVPPLSPVDLGPTDGFYGPTSPPSHDEAMGFNHQADGRAPTQIMPYPEKG